MNPIFSLQVRKLLWLLRKENILSWLIQLKNPWCHRKQRHSDHSLPFFTSVWASATHFQYLWPISGSIYTSCWPKAPLSKAQSVFGDSKSLQARMLRLRQNSGKSNLGWGREEDKREQGKWATFLCGHILRISILKWPPYAKASNRQTARPLLGKQNLPYKELMGALKVF